MKRTPALLGIFALILLAAVFGGRKMPEGPKQETQTSTPRAVSVRPESSAAEPTAAHPAEAELNALGFTANGLGLAVRKIEKGGRL